MSEIRLCIAVDQHLNGFWWIGLSLVLVDVMRLRGIQFAGVAAYGSGESEKDEDARWIEHDLKSLGQKWNEITSEVKIHIGIKTRWIAKLWLSDVGGVIGVGSVASCFSHHSSWMSGGPEMSTTARCHADATHDLYEE